MSMTLAQLAELRIAVKHTVGGIETPRLIIAALDELAAIKSAPDPAAVAVDAGALESLREAVESSFDIGCLSGFCLVTGSRSGMHTNASCRCWRNSVLVQRVMQDRLKLLEAARRLLEGDKQ